MLRRYGWGTCSALFIISAILTGALPGFGWAADLPGSSDHPLIKRCGGSEIVACDSKRFEVYELQTSTFKRYDLEAKRREFVEPPLKLEGGLTPIWYESPGEASPTELLRNYQNELYDSNLGLSKRRAEAVVSVLSEEFGIAAGRLTANGVSCLAPVAVNTTEEGRARNRRVELVPQ